jgi:nucleoid DNA-binding protein
VSAPFIARAVDNKDGHKRTIKSLSNMRRPHHLHYRKPLFTNKKCFRILKHISEWLKSVVLKNRAIQVRGFAAFEKRKRQCPASIKERFRDRRRIIAEDHDILNYENA